MNDEPAATRIFDTRAGLHAALHEALDDMARNACRAVWWVDEDFAEWPLGERAVVDRLTRWAALPQTRLVVIARHFDEVVRRHARWVAWRREWAHRVECRAFEDAPSTALPRLLLAPDCVALRVADPSSPRGWLSHEAARGLLLREEIDAISQRSVVSFPASVLGL